jgi:hypothetical protein
VDRDRKITVRPIGGGWCVACSVTGELMFLSGARAEEKARALAACFARLGSDVHLEVHDLRDQLVATRRYFGDVAAPRRSPAIQLLELAN